MIGQADKVFLYIAQALEASVLGGQMLTRTVTIAKALAASGSFNAEALLQSNFGPEAQNLIMGHFS